MHHATGPTGRRMRIAVVGSGIAGLSAAWLLSQAHDVTVLERDDRLGGHSNTAHVRSTIAILHVDTGFMVFNTRLIPIL